MKVRVTILIKSLRGTFCEEKKNEERERERIQTFWRLSYSLRDFVELMKPSNEYFSSLVLRFHPENQFADIKFFFIYFRSKLSESENYLTISSFGLTNSRECRLIACIAALLPLTAAVELDEDVDKVGEAVPVVVSATDVGGIGFLIIVTGCVFVDCGPA